MTQDIAEPLIKEGYFARRVMDYDGIHLEPGMIFQPLGRANDAVMISVNYIAPIRDFYPHGVEAHQCLRCSMEFVDFSYKAMHDAKCLAQSFETDPAIQVIEEAIASGGQIVNPNDPAVQWKAVNGL